MTYEDEGHSNSEHGLLESTPTASAHANVKVAHVQLRDLIVCPGHRGVVWYVGSDCIMEHNILDAHAKPRVLANLTFTPVTLSTLLLPGCRVLLAAGGQDRELFLALYGIDVTLPSPSQATRPTTSPSPRFFSSRISSPVSSSVTSRESLLNIGPRPRSTKKDFRDDGPSQSRKNHFSREIWKHYSQFDYPASINNSVVLYLPPVLSTLQSSGYLDSQTEADHSSPPRLAVSNNDCTVKFLDISLKEGGFGAKVNWCGSERGHEREEERFRCVGVLKLPVPVNHSSISPDGSTLLSCGDSSSIYLHRIIPDASRSILGSASYALHFEPLATLSLLPSPSYPCPTINPYLPYAFVDGTWTLAGAPTSSCFATAWNKDGSKFSVASQEGMVLVWDVRSGEPLTDGRWETERVDDSNVSRAREMNVSDEWRRGLPEDHIVWYSGSEEAPSWGVRSLKFAKSSGRELLVFTEHASKIHVIDADTFSAHDTIRIPLVSQQKPTLSASSTPYNEVSTPISNNAINDFVRSHDQRVNDFLTRDFPGQRTSRTSGSSWNRPSSLSNQRTSMTIGAHPMSSGGPRHSSISARVLSPSHALSTSPDDMTSESGPRRRPVSPILTSFRLPHYSYLVGRRSPPHSRAVAGRRAMNPPIPPDRPSERTRRLDPHQIGDRERRAAEMRNMGIEVEDSLMEEDIAWHMVLDALEREDIVMASDRARASGWDQAEHSTAASGGTGQEGQQNDTERHSSLLDNLESARLRTDETDTGTTPGSTTTVDDNDGSSLRDWDFECTTPASPPLFSTDFVLVSPSHNESVLASDDVEETPSVIPNAPYSPDTEVAIPRQEPSRTSHHLGEMIEPASRQRLDIAGICFDNSGSYMYVATSDGITEWKVKDSELRWWGEGGVL